MDDGDSERERLTKLTLWLRAIRWGIFGAILGAFAAGWLALSRRVPAALTGVLGTDLALAGAGAGVGVRLLLARVKAARVRHRRR